MGDWRTMQTDQDTSILAYIMMLDVSGSMASALPMVKIDAKAFVRQTRTGDEFGINTFSTYADWLYPSGSYPDIVTVHEDGKELREAIEAIEKIATFASTNIGAAIRLANIMIENAPAKKRAFVLVSDGQHNTGSDPETILETEPPIYIAGLGIIETAYFERMLKKNTKSRFYNAPNAAQMEMVFNQIIADTMDRTLLYNRYHLLGNEPSRFEAEFIVRASSGHPEAITAVVVWTDARFHKAGNSADKYGVDITVVSPEGEELSCQSDSETGGYAVLHFEADKPGAWRLITTYNDAGDGGNTGQTVGVFTEAARPVDVELPITIERGKPITCVIRPSVREVLQDCVIEADICLERPNFDIDSLMEHYEDRTHGDYKELKKLREERIADGGEDIFPTVRSGKTARVKATDKNGEEVSFDDTTYKGSYGIHAEIKGLKDGKVIFRYCFDRAVCVA